MNCHPSLPSERFTIPHVIRSLLYNLSISVLTEHSALNCVLSKLTWDPSSRNPSKGSTAGKMLGVVGTTNFGAAFYYNKDKVNQFVIKRTNNSMYISEDKMNE